MASINEISNLIESLRKIAKLQRMTGTQTAQMIKAFLESNDVSVPEIFINQNSKHEEPFGAIDSAKEILLSILSDGPKMSNEIFEITDAENISRRTLLRAKNELGIKSSKVGFAGYWIWQLCN